MVKPSWPGGRKNYLFWKNRSQAYWILFTVILACLVSVLIVLWPGKNQQPKKIPLEALSRIHQEKLKAQKDFAEFIKTPAGKIWQKYPYWDPATCQKIAEGQVFLEMSKEQAREAAGTPVKVRSEKRGNMILEEWIFDGKEKMILRFENNVLRSIEKK
ncbi:MAG: hypothetical protein FJ117_13870 [Deltaproteobacteria bacterium]|nr:hypothetical protein [Deltaproteobacteria bacterium]